MWTSCYTDATLNTSTSYDMVSSILGKAVPTQSYRDTDFEKGLRKGSACLKLNVLFFRMYQGRFI
jgi:hypothetical protein